MSERQDYGGPVLDQSIRLQRFAIMFQDSSHAQLLRSGMILFFLFFTAFQDHEAAADSPQNPGIQTQISEQFASQIHPLLIDYCQSCHSGEKPKGKFRSTELTTDFKDSKNLSRWRDLLQQVKASTMPPPDQPRPTEEESQRLMRWIDQFLEFATITRRETEGRVVLRRLNRVEYENTVCDLLGIETELKELLPLDTSAEGFDNIGEALHTSPFLLERYLEAAETALNMAIVNGPQPPLIKQRYSLKETHQVKSTTESVFRKQGDSVVMFSSSAWQAVSLSPFYPPNRGQYRFRISAAAVQSPEKPVTFRVDAGLMLMTGKPHLVGYFDTPPSAADTSSTIVEFVDNLEPRNTIRIIPYGLESAQAVNKIGADKYEGRGLAVDWIDVEGPLYDQWPPESHRRLFGELQQGPAPIRDQQNRVEVISSNPTADAEQVLRNFARRAFRRPVTDDDLQPFLKVIAARMAEQQSFEQSVRVGLIAILTAPDFLFLRETTGKLDDFALASRLSYFLWSSMPDQELFELAEQKKLSQPETLRAQVERMLKDSKSSSFTQNFIGQWLGLRDIDFTEPSALLYPEYDSMLRASIVKETELFFQEVLQQDLSVANFIASDFSILNGRLAKHYGIPGIDGFTFRKVTLPPESHRGGLLTMASVLKVTANGTTTSPVTRGAWVLDRILGTPPPRPPENVAALEPDIRGATTIREQLAKHRQVATCASCHQQIDPPGFALENFDVIGGWRDHYRTTGNGGPVVVEGRRMPYHQGKSVDASDILPDGRAFRDSDEFKQLLLKDKDQLARSLATKLFTYATGAPPESVDKPEIETIVAHIRDRNYGLRSLIHEIVQSHIFRTK